MPRLYLFTTLTGDEIANRDVVAQSGQCNRGAVRAGHAPPRPPPGNFERRGWKRWNEDPAGDWNVYWASVTTTRNMFNPDSGFRLGDHQLVNHFPNHYELTRKDLMYKNVKRYRKDLRKAGYDDARLNFVPTTFILPQDYTLFLEEHKKGRVGTWIFKPHGRAQGRGIFLVNKLSQIKRLGPKGGGSGERNPLDMYVICEYIDRPLLVGGRKFDLRVYVVVASYRPLIAYIARAGFARFCNVKYSSEAGELRNSEMHLTNVAVQKGGDQYNASHGNKWAMADVFQYLAAVRGSAAAWKLREDMDFLVVHSLKAVQSVMISDKHCFEMYGYDIMIDDDLKPWLLEANASPSLSTTTPEDKALKMRVINDTLQVVSPPNWSSVDSRRAKAFPEKVGCLELLYNETEELQAVRSSPAPRRGAGFQRPGTVGTPRRNPSMRV